MKKIKLLYDVARTMKNMAKIDGVITVAVKKDQETVFSLRNQFEKDDAGKVTAKVSSTMNMNGGSVKRESNTEFNMAGDCQHGPCMIWKSFHKHHGAHGLHGIRGMYHRISFVLGILSSLTVEDRADGAASISLNIKDLPEEIKTLLWEKMQQKHSHHQGMDCLLGCQDVELLDGFVVLSVNERHAIDKLTVNLSGRARDEEHRPHTMAASAELQFAW